MAQHRIVTLASLVDGLALAPERYDPRRGPAQQGCPLLQIIEVMREQLNPARDDGRYRYLVLDTSDVAEGIIRPSRDPMPAPMIGSSKKVVRAGDVLISRLRPYLRQVGYVDPGLASEFGDDVKVVCSTEFFVLRSRGGGKLGFLVPYLLSRGVQVLLAAAQEGGHHPRFNQATLETLRLPDWLIERAGEISARVESAAASARQADLTLRHLVGLFSDSATSPVVPVGT